MSAFKWSWEVKTGEAPARYRTGKTSDLGNIHNALSDALNAVGGSVNVDKVIITRVEVPVVVELTEAEQLAVETVIASRVSAAVDLPLNTAYWKIRDAKPRW
jgi:hypothetical protein